MTLWGRDRRTAWCHEEKIQRERSGLREKDKMLQRQEERIGVTNERTRWWCVDHSGEGMSSVCVWMEWRIGELERLGRVWKGCETEGNKKWRKLKGRGNDQENMDGSKRIKKKIMYSSRKMLTQYPNRFLLLTTDFARLYFPYLKNAKVAFYPPVT